MTSYIFEWGHWSELNVRCICVSFALDSKYVQFQIICSLLCSLIVDTFEVDPCSIPYKKCQVKPTNTHTKVPSPKIRFQPKTFKEDCVLLFAESSPETMVEMKGASNIDGTYRECVKPNTCSANTGNIGDFRSNESMY